MLGSIGRSPALGTTLSVSTSGNCRRVYAIRGSMRAARISLLKIAEFGRTAIKRRFAPRRLVTILVSSSSRLTPRRCPLGRIAQKIDRDRISLHRVHVEAIPESMCELAACYTSANDNSVSFDGIVHAFRLLSRTRRRSNSHSGRSTLDRLDDPGHPKIGRHVVHRHEQVRV